MVAVMVYLLVIPCIIRTNDDFALRCDCCPQSGPGEAMGRHSPVSVIRIPSSKTLRLTSPVTRLRVSPAPETEHWLHRPRQEDSPGASLTSMSVSVPATPRSDNNMTHSLLSLPSLKVVNQTKQ